MSYDIRLLDPVTHETIEIDEPHFMRGGTYAIGGTQELWLNITYNYSRFHYHDDVFGEKYYSVMENFEAVFASRTGYTASETDTSPCVAPWTMMILARFCFLLTMCSLASLQEERGSINDA